MKKMLLSFCIAIGINASAQSFTPGNVVVYRYGDGVTTMPLGFVVPVFLDEYSPSGTFIQTKAIPTTTNGLNFRLTGLGKLASGLYQQEGMSTLSQDGKYITIFGYNQAPGSGVPFTADGLVVGIVAADGSYNSTTTLSNAATVGLGAPRSAVVNGTDIWANGFNNGVQYTTLGSLSTSTRVSVGAQNSPRTMNIFNDTLYVPIGSSATLARVGPLPTTPVTITTQSISTPQPTTNQVFVLKVGGLLRMYTADDGATTGNTIRRYYLNDAGTTWVVDGTISSLPATAFVKSITGASKVEGTKTIVELYATSWGNDGSGTETSKLLKFTDTFTTATPKDPAVTTAITTIATAPANTVFRSVTLAPTNSAAIGTVILPLSLQSFNAGFDGKNTTLYWTTVNEVNVKDFTIEKSADAISFNAIGTRLASNNSQLNSYTFVDNTTATTAYYRLKMTDKNGSFSYSATIKVSATNANSKSISIAPNPVAGSYINISHPKSQAGSTISIFSVQGKLMQTVKVQAGATQSVVMLQGLVSGSYVIEYIDATGNTKQNLSFIKQ